ncbi:MAG TPA: formylglycine-generating enzyme family protein [Ohtaekwangia sp.]|nr:formylglycine-generating enzyme family protein [Ohtaekwangia sp.]
MTPLISLIYIRFITLKPRLLYFVIATALLLQCSKMPEGDTTETFCIAVKDTCGLCKQPSSRSALMKASVAFHDSLTTQSSHEGMVLITGGTFRMGSDNFSDSKPVHPVTVKSFYMDEHEVTNSAFAEFVKATGYVTVAEQPLNPTDFPGVPIEKLLPGSVVFTPPSHPVSLDNPMQWWTYVAGANWKHPKGPDSNIAGKDNQPVVQVCYPDAVAYATWAGKRLPTEAEWEYAARAGQYYGNFYWGSDLKSKGKWVANIFQGSFPHDNKEEDGFLDLAPIKSFPPNAFGLYDMEGNVWEWCHDLYRPDAYAKSVSIDPQGPEDSYDPGEPGVQKHVQRGGSFLCSDDYCIRYKAGSRGKGETNSAANNLGFRCVMDVE